MRVLSPSHLVSSEPEDAGPGPQTTYTPGTGSAVPVYIAANTLSASFFTPAVSKLHIYNYSLQAILTSSFTGSSGAVTGTLFVQASNYTPKRPSFVGQLGYGVPEWSWQTVPSSSAVVTCGPGTSGSTAVSSGQYFLNAPAQAYSWFRVGWTHTSGTGSLDVFAAGHGTSQ